MAKERTESSLRCCPQGLGGAACQQVRWGCSDMWTPCLNVLTEKLGGAVPVLDRFDVMESLGKAFDEVRGGGKTLAA